MRRTAGRSLLVVVLVLAGCGGGSDQEEEPPITRAEFIAKTDAQCKASNARTRRLNEQVARTVARARGERELLERLAPILQRGYGQIRDNAAAFQAVNPPPEDAAQIERIRKLYDEQAELVRKLAAAARRGDGRAFQMLSAQQLELRERARRAARSYGFVECGSTKSDAR